MTCAQATAGSRPTSTLPPRRSSTARSASCTACASSRTSSPPVIKSLTVANANGGAVYATYFFGKDSFGIIDPEGGALEMIIHDKGEIGGPLNQFSTIGYKFETNGATILYPERLLRVMSCSSFSAEDEEN